MLRVRYSESDIIIFADINIDHELPSGKKFFDKLDRSAWLPLFAPHPTRLGVG
jgi:hypothetical protein